ncbi:MAG: hypothetical protein H0T89_05800 [Deltaproteobacteria bacterium]|nr:hypothetical protein [Deltaproteobacteria bacterium]MDQ3298147.1 hypothetical protein [Myxococcota bacterium]
MRYLVVLWFAIVLAACSGERKPEDRRTALQRTLRESAGEAFDHAAREYRELLGESPEALRDLAEIHRERGERTEELALRRTLILRKQATAKDRLRAVDLLALKDTPIDEPTYQTGLGWLTDALDQEPSSCEIADSLVMWTQQRSEHAGVIERGLARCPIDHYRARWFGMRIKDHPAIACDAVIHGDASVAQACVDAGGAPWKVAVAKAVLGEAPLDNLRAASRDPGATVYVLVRLASTPGIPTDEACQAIARASKLEAGWPHRAPEGVHATYAVLRKRAGCL